MKPPAPDPMDSKSQKLDGLEALRGVAALVVLLHHAFGLISLPQNFNTTLIGGVFLEGNLGVNIFFVLSGFVIMWANPRDGRSAREVLVYALRRMTRIFPRYWLACLTMLPLYFNFGPSRLGEVTPLRVVHDVLLLPWKTEPMLPAAWTLVFEMLFYFLFVPMLWSRRAGLALWGLITGAIIAVMATGVTLSNPWAIHLTSPYVLEFLMGLTVCLWLKRHPLRPKAGKALVWIGSLAILGFALTQFRLGGQRVPANLHYALCAALLVAGLVSLPAPAGGQHHRLFRCLQILGRYSYSIYLFHIPVQQIILRPSVKLLGNSPGMAVVLTILTLMIAVSLAAGMAVGKYFELPALEWCKRRIATLKPRPAPAPAPAANPS